MRQEWQSDTNFRGLAVKLVLLIALSHTLAFVLGWMLGRP